MTRAYEDDFEKLENRLKSPVSSAESSGQGSLANDTPDALGYGFCSMGCETTKMVF